MGYFQALATGIWHPDEATEAALRADWEAIRTRVAAGLPLSESLTRVLGAATKGPGHGSSSRAWSLKQPFMGWLYGQVSGTRPPPPHTLAPSPEAAFEGAILARLKEVHGLTTSEIAFRLGGAIGTAKNADAGTVRRWLGQPSRGRTGDFERIGIEFKTVPVTSDGTPIESMSFPAFSHKRMSSRAGRTRTSSADSNRLLIVPLNRRRGDRRGVAHIGRSFFWSPTEDELRGSGGSGNDSEGYRDRRSRELPPPRRRATCISGLTVAMRPN